MCRVCDRSGVKAYLITDHLHVLKVLDPCCTVSTRSLSILRITYSRAQFELDFDHSSSSSLIAAYVSNVRSSFTTLPLKTSIYHGRC